MSKIIYVAYTGTKVKGLWDSTDAALRYGATHPDVDILKIDVEASSMREQVTALRAMLAEQHGPIKAGDTVALHADGISTKAKAH